MRPGGGLASIINRKLPGQNMDWLFKLLKDTGRAISIESTSELRLQPLAKANFLITEKFYLGKFRLNITVLSRIDDVQTASIGLKSGVESSILGHLNALIKIACNVVGSGWCFVLKLILRPSCHAQSIVVASPCTLSAYVSIQLGLEPLWKRKAAPKGVMTAVPPPVQQSIKRKFLPLIPNQFSSSPERVQKM